MIPSFAVGRTQEMLYFIRQIKADGLVYGHDGFKVYVDSPLANEATTIFSEHQYDCFDEEAMELIKKGINPISFPGLKVSVTSDDSKSINYDEEPKVIIPQIMFQMVPDSARLAHSGSGYNDFWSAVKIDQFGIVTRHRKPQTRKYKRVNSLIHQFHCLFIKTISLILCKHTGCLNRKRTVHIHIKVREITQQILLFDLTDKIQ